jgi:hypothetical protein
MYVAASGRLVQSRRLLQSAGDAERQKCIFYRNKGNRNRDNIDKRQVLEGDEPLRSCRIRVEQLGADRGCTGRHSCHHQRGYAEEAIARIEHGSREHEKVEHPDSCAGQRQGFEEHEPQREVEYSPCAHFEFHDERRRDRPPSGEPASRGGQ